MQHTSLSVRSVGDRKKRAHSPAISACIPSKKSAVGIFCVGTRKDERSAEKVKEALAVGLVPILCIGETQDERKKGFEKEIIAMQLRTILDLITDVSQLSALVIAYEPVWAIGTGENATPSDAQEMHVFIRSLLPKDIAESTRILYGGSVKPENAAGIFAEPDIDGALIGGASLNPESFRKIVESLPA